MEEIKPKFNVGDSIYVCEQEIVSQEKCKCCNTILNRIIKYKVKTKKIENIRIEISGVKAIGRTAQIFNVFYKLKGNWYDANIREEQIDFNRYYTIKEKAQEECNRLNKQDDNIKEGLLLATE